MFDVNEENIKRNCYSNEIYKKGMQYFLTGRVRDVRAEEDCIKAQVIGTYDYNVYAQFLHDGRLGHTGCECRAYETYPGYCKHIVALLMYIINEGDIIMNMRDSRISSKILNFFENKIAPDLKIPVNVEIGIELLLIGYYSRKVQPALYLRMGHKKMYMVKNIKNFVEQANSKNIIEFGKEFTYNPSLYCFRDSDKAIMDFITEMYEIDSVTRNSSDYMYNAGTIFKGKYLYLSPVSLGRLFSLLKDRSFSFIIRGAKYDNVTVLDEDLPVNFDLQKSGADLMLYVDLPKDMEVLTPEGKYVFYKEHIYNVSESQRENLLPFYNALLQSGERRIRILEGDRERFASIVIPHIKSAGKLKIDESVSSLFYRQPLLSKIYLDKEGQKVTAAVNFIYGDFVIDPFDDSRFINRSGAIVLRDIEGERKVLHIIEQSGFKINKEHIYLDEDEKIYNFVLEYLPLLQKQCEVYYSEAFKNMRIYDSSFCRSSVRLDNKLDLLEFSFSIDGVDKNELPNIFASLKHKKKYYRLADGSFLPLGNNDLISISKLMEYMDIEKREIGKGVIKFPKYKSLYVDEQLKSLESVSIERDASFKRLIRNIKESKDIEYELPLGLTGTLRSYQIRGFKWLKSLAQYGFGGILADDMGLGKTLQAIAFLLSEKESYDSPSLVICPTSLIYNWENEIQKFAPNLRTLVISGNKSERNSFFKDIQNYDVIITSYPLIRRDVESYRDIHFSYCIIDEAQHIKNPNSQNARSVKDINAKGRFALTGTPLENNLTELWSIFDFVMPGYLMSHDKFVEVFERPIISNQDKEALNELKRYVKPFIMRRLKRDVLKELPPKIESVLTAELTERQKAVYLSYLHQIRGLIEEEVSKKGFEKSRIQILAGLTRLRQICCHPSLFIENYEGGSGKMDLLIEIIEELIDGGHRALLFSQFTGALKLIRSVLMEEGISCFYLDGSIEAAERGRMVKLFNEGEKNIFLISLKAGGTGLNLTGADTVIHFDPWWNPAVEDQATDRAYRIGQENAVQVMKMITRGTIEEKIYKLQEKKRELIGSILQPGETFISKMNQEDIMELFKL